MSFDFAKFCTNYDFPTAPEGNKHNTRGWINVPCPFCVGNPGWHLGYEIANNRFKCFRCGSHTAFDVVHALLNCSTGEAATVLAKYKGRPTMRVEATGRRKQLKAIKWPLGCGPLNDAHKAYLKSRNFNPLDLEEKWGLRGTGPIGPYKFRIIAPIHFQGVFVSYQGRDITGKSQMPYKACRAEDESRPHQDCLYGLEHVVGGCVVVVEGIVDVWRLGYGAAATFGIEFTKQQVILLSRFERRYIIYDNETQAQNKAHELAASLSALGGESYILNFDVADPAEMSQRAADLLMKNLTGRKEE